MSSGAAESSRTEPEGAGRPPGEETGRDLASTFAGVAGYVDNLPTGERAELRRLRGQYREMPPEVFWRIVDRYDIPPRDEDFWIDVVPLMVEHPHEPRSRTGRVLARSGVSSARLEKWLRLDREGALDEAGRLLSQVDGAIDWVQFAFLLYLWNHPEHGERNRRDLAREYFIEGGSRDSS